MKRNTTLQSLGKMKRVEAMIMKRRLRWLGLTERAEDSRLPQMLPDMQARHWDEVTWRPEELM